MTADLERWGTPTRTGLVLADGIPFNDARDITERVIRMGDSSNWWIGDALAYLERFRRDYPEALALLDRTYSSQKVLRWVAERVAPVTRVTALSWSHHRLVASFELDEQRYWLDEALRQGFTVRELDGAIAVARGTSRPPALTLRAIGELYDLCVRAAAHAGLDPAEWAAAALARAAGDELAAA